MNILTLTGNLQIYETKPLDKINSEERGVTVRAFGD